MAAITKTHPYDKIFWEKKAMNVLTRGTLTLLVLLPALLVAGSAWAQLAAPQQFTSGTVISSADVNAIHNAAQTEINLKQNRVSGTCPTGAVNGINADGTVSCTPDFASQISALTARVTLLESLLSEGSVATPLNVAIDGAQQGAVGPNATSYYYFKTPLEFGGTHTITVGNTNSDLIWRLYSTADFTTTQVDSCDTSTAVVDETCKTSILEPNATYYLALSELAGKPSGFTITVAKPAVDFTVALVSVAGTNITYTITNLGTDTFKGTLAMGFTGNSPTEPTYWDGTNTTTQTIAAGATTANILQSFKNKATTPATSWMTVDTNLRIPETNETNNISAGFVW